MFVEEEIENTKRGECGFGTWTSFHPFLVSQDKIQQGRFFVLDYLLVPVHPDPHAFLDICGGDAVGKIHHKLGELLHVDYVLGVLGVSVDYLGTSCNLHYLQHSESAKETNVFNNRSQYKLASILIVKKGSCRSQNCYYKVYYNPALRS